MKPLRLFLVATLLATGGACGGGTDPDPLAGTYLATTFEVTSAGSTRNVLAEGGTLGINVATTTSSGYVTVGTLIIPPAGGGDAFMAHLAGTATLSGNTVRFAQAADTFVRDLTFTLVENRLEARSQTLGTATYDIVLARQ